MASPPSTRTPPPTQCRLSTRISLRWLPDLAFENTDTVVMSVKDWYVDLRVDKDSGEMIDWAIAGRRIVEKEDSERRVIFTHELDSHNTFDAVDCGTFTTLPNGDDLEIGSMPRADRPDAPITAYEEVWREMQFREGPEGHGKGVSWILGSESDCEKQDKKGEEESQVTKTFIARIWGTYMALQQPQTYAWMRNPSGGKWEVIKKEGGEVSARLEEWDQSSSRWKERYVLGSKGDDLPSLARGIPELEEAKESWRDSYARVTVGGEWYVVRAFEEIS